MIKTTEKIIISLATNPRKLFLLDSLGAMLTLVFLSVVIQNLRQYFGIPEDILQYLSVAVLMFCVYSVTCYFFLKGNWPPFIRTIGIANLLYCFCTLILLILYSKILTPQGIAYFLIESVIILILVYIELSVASLISKKNKHSYKSN